MTVQNDGGPAFPGKKLVSTMTAYKETQHLSGMSLRDWFAGQALAATLSWDFGNEWGKEGRDHKHRAARSAYAIADAMLVAREGTGTGGGAGDGSEATGGGA